MRHRTGPLSPGQTRILQRQIHPETSAGLPVTATDGLIHPAFIIMMLRRRTAQEESAAMSRPRKEAEKIVNDGMTGANDYQRANLLRMHPMACSYGSADAGPPISESTPDLDGCGSYLSNRAWCRSVAPVLRHFETRPAGGRLSSAAAPGSPVPCE